MTKRCLTQNSESFFTDDVIKYLCALLIKINENDSYKILHGLMSTCKSYFGFIEPYFSKAIYLFYPGHVKKYLCHQCNQTSCVDCLVTCFRCLKRGCGDDLCDKKEWQVVLVRKNGTLSKLHSYLTLDWYCGCQDKFGGDDGSGGTIHLYGIDTIYSDEEDENIQTKTENVDLM